MAKDKKESPITFKRLWEKNNNTIWLASTISLYRNIDKFHFPQHLNKEKKENISNLITDVLKEQPALKNIQIITGDRASPLERDFLMEHLKRQEAFLFKSMPMIICKCIL
jgi:protein arginine kinase